MYDIKNYVYNSYLINTKQMIDNELLFYSNSCQ